MAKEPARFRGLVGAARAADRAGRRDVARANYAELITLVSRADTALVEIEEAKRFLARP
jgi:hypothetical protein